MTPPQSPALVPLSMSPVHSSTFLLSMSGTLSKSKSQRKLSFKSETPAQFYIVIVSFYNITITIALYLCQLWLLSVFLTFSDFVGCNIVAFTEILICISLMTKLVECLFLKLMGFLDICFEATVCLPKT